MTGENNGAVGIMEQTLAALQARRQEVVTSAESLRTRLQSAELEVERLDRAVQVQEQAIEQVKAPAPKRRARKKSARPYARHEPAPGTMAGDLLRILRDPRIDRVGEGTGITIGNLTRISGLPADTVRRTMPDLVERGYATRVAEGVYAPDKVTSTEDNGQ